MTETTSNSPLAALAANWGPDLRAPVVSILGGLLVLQLLLSLLLHVGGERALAPAATDAPLLGFEPARIQRLRIEGPAGTPAGADDAGVTLARRDGGWVLTELADFPVQDTKVQQLLETLSGLRRPLPVTASASALERFKVSGTNFERRLTLEDERGPVATLLAGETPGFRRILARPDGDPGVYDLRLALAELSPRRDDWIARDVLWLDPEHIARIGGAGWTLLRDGDTWRAEGEGAPDADGAAALARTLANLSYRGVLGSTDEPTYRQSAPELLLRAELTDGTSREYRISQAEGSEDRVLKVSDRPYYFKLSRFDLEGLPGIAPPPAPADRP